MTPMQRHTHPLPLGLYLQYTTHCYKALTRTLHMHRLQHATLHIATGPSPLGFTYTTLTIQCYTTMYQNTTWRISIADRLHRLHQATLHHATPHQFRPPWAYLNTIRICGWMSQCTQTTSLDVLVLFYVEPTQSVIFAGS